MNHLLIKDLLVHLGQLVCDQLHQSLKKQSSIDELSTVFHTGEDDVIYEIDRKAEELIIPFIREKAETLGGVVLIGEGLGNRESPLILPSGKKESSCSVRIIIDPIDGTRGIMYDKRSAFFLAGAAPNKGYDTTLQDIEVAVMVELPTSKAAYSDALWAIKGKGCKAERRNLFTGEITERDITPSKAKTIRGGFAEISRFFPPGKNILAGIEEELIHTLFPDNSSENPLTFEDQYISSSGQLYEMLCGHDRFIAELRTALYNKMRKEGKQGGHCCHPYDVCAHLIGLEAGIVITDANGNPLNCPLNTTESVDWIAYANKDIQEEVWPALKTILVREKFI